MSKLSFFLSLLISLTLIRCVPPTEEKLVDVAVNFNNAEQQHLYDLQDKGLTDSLYPYFRHKDPTFRYLSVLAFASIKDTLAVDSLIRLLRDPIDEVRVAAAYALGQTGHPKAEQSLVDAFDRYDTVGVSKFFNNAILEAIGKCGTAPFLTSLAGINTYKTTDTVLLEGQARGIYRYALRDIVAAEGTARMVDFATQLKFPPSVRFIAANYLSRAKNIVLEKADSLIAPAIPREDDPRIRMALVIALGKTKSERATNALLFQYNLEQDYRVRCNILRALTNFDYEKVKPTVLQALKDPNTAVATTAAQFFVEKGTSEDASTYWQMAKEPGGKWQVQLTLYAAASKLMPGFYEESRKYLNWELKRRFETASNSYEKAAALHALAEYGWNYRYIRDASFPSELPAVRTAGIEALAKIAAMPNFNQLFGGGNTARRELRDIFIEAIQTGDVGMTAEAAKALRQEKSGFKSIVDTLAFLENALIKLKRPQDIEAYNEVKKTLEFFQNVKDDQPSKPKFSHPIDWKLIASLKENSKVLIKTKKGDIILKLMPEQAPGSVANFLELIKNKFFNGKNFHRVVPNFVIQGGCPRGDGYGSLNYTIRSELPYLHYDREGYVGMASAGNHTEGTQFFITHSPTPHLDGNYTIFAKVVEGIDVVHQIEMGDVMQEVTVVEK
jgi:cyclophilin family peptidyl-prolyl cis-trans isomerase/HEAT repeat protein